MTNSQSKPAELIQGFNDRVNEQVGATYNVILKELLVGLGKHIALLQQSDRPPDKTCRVQTYNVRKKYNYLHIVCDTPVFDSIDKHHERTKIRSRHICKDKQVMSGEYENSQDYQDWVHRFANQKLLELLEKKRESLVKELEELNLATATVNTHNSSDSSMEGSDVIHRTIEAPLATEKPVPTLYDGWDEAKELRKKYRQKEGLLTLVEVADHLNLHQKEAYLAEKEGLFENSGVSVRTFPEDCLYKVQGDFSEFDKREIIGQLNDIIYYKPPLNLTAKQRQYLKENTTLTKLQACEFFGIAPEKFDKLKKKYPIDYVDKMRGRYGHRYNIYKLSDLEAMANFCGFKRSSNRSMEIKEDVNRTIAAKNRKKKTREC